MNNLKNLSSKYDFTKVEEGKYDTWVKNGYFTAGDVSKKPYTIVIPPPNITGKLHIGHVFDNTLQDIVIRRKRMQGYDALYLPGMDHASIATQAKVEQKLREKGISRYDLGREKFLKECWRWKDEHSDIIHKQWRKIGISVDYSRERFTLDKGLNDAVNEVFVKMYNDGLIYRGEKIINWDVQSKTALSNMEVEYKSDKGAFYHVLYPFVDEEGGLEIATTRPETMFADQALMVHPEDERFKKYVGKKVRIPLTDIVIPVITDEYVDREFGTGVVKVTPAHDPNDFEVGVRHNLAKPLCINEDGTMNSMAGKYEGMDRIECRKEVAIELKKEGYLLKIKNIVHDVGHSERTGVPVEPMLSKQWFVDMKPLSKMVIDLQKDERKKIHFVPARFETNFLQWMYNIQDWCISRQLWWGHQIPAWYKGDEVYVGTEAPKGDGWVRDTDALDTWFSSALWPFSTLGWPKETPDFKKYFPTNVLGTGYDIIFFWVARMTFQSLYLNGERPFEYVLIHGLIRDEQGRKVSKSLNNGIDIYETFDKYGVDAVRYFLTTTGSPGQDLRYSDTKLESTWNYLNKLWNISRYIGLCLDKYNYDDEDIDIKLLNSSDKWILNELNKVIKKSDVNYEKFDFGNVAKTIYNFTWNSFASWYLEMTKVVFQGNNTTEEKINTCAVLTYVLRNILKLLHPFTPFITEEIYQMFNDGSITVSKWPEINKSYSFKDAKKIKIIFDIITAIRNIRTDKNVANSKKITLLLQTNDLKVKAYIQDNLKYLEKFANYEVLEFVDSTYDTKQCVVTVLNNVTVIIPLNTLVDMEEERQKLLIDKSKMENEIMRCDKMLSNQKFIDKAPQAKIDDEMRKRSEYQKKLDEIIKLLEE
ncbi:MAG: valine--tRNA ligase [Bacilli bacterium]